MELLGSLSKRGRIIPTWKCFFLNVLTLLFFPCVNVFLMIRQNDWLSLFLLPSHSSPTELHTFCHFSAFINSLAIFSSEAVVAPLYSRRVASEWCLLCLLSWSGSLFSVSPASLLEQDLGHRVHSVTWRALPT